MSPPFSKTGRQILRQTDTHKQFDGFMDESRREILMELVRVTQMQASSSQLLDLQERYIYTI